MIRKILAATAVFFSGLATAQAADLTVTIVGHPDATGSLSVGLFNSASTFPKPPQAFASARVKAGQGGVSVTFHNLPPGTYAASAYHDENNNGKLDTDGVGFPTERFGFSNDARGTLGPPDFAKAAFELGAQNKSVTVKVSK